jgi:hypothetical protein
MNALPVGPSGVMDAESRTRYFADLERWGFDIPYNAYYAGLFDQVVGEQKLAYVEFAAEAHKRGYPACIQIQTTVCAGDRVGIDQAQYDVENKPEVLGNGNFFASFSSRAWRDYLKELTTIFVQQYGYDWVIFEEPMYRVDIPGSKDPFYAEFTAAHMDVAYPKKREETTQYLLVQQAKADALVDFCRELVVHAKGVGAKKAGVMPWFFIPTIENTPPETLNPACNIQRIAAIPELDTIVVRMQPDNVYCGTMRTGDDMCESPKLYHSEILAHSLGKDVIAVSNPTDEHTDYPACPLIPFEFFRDYTLAGAAASPGGFTRHWYGQNYGKDTKHMEVLADVASFAGRLGQPCAPVAFVFSYSGTQHAEPYTYETVFPFYWELAKRLQFQQRVPMLTFFADTLEEDLARHPEVQLLVLEEHFPLTQSQMMAISRWWQGEEKRGLVAFGTGLGFCADPESPGVRPSSASCPGVFELIGLKQEEVPQYIAEQPIALKDVSRIRRSAFLGDQTQLKVNTIANVRRVFGSRASVLYEVDALETHVPVIAEWRDRATLALFCGFGLTADTVDAADKAVRYALREVDFPGLILDSCSEGVLWGINKQDYIVVSNLSDKPGTATGRPGRANFWDCREQKVLPDGDVEIKVDANSFGVFRVVGRRSKFLDVLGASYLRKLTDGAGRADIELLAGRKTTFVLRASPKEIMVDGKHSTVTQEVINGAYHVTLQQCPPGERKIALKW